jgi:ubiquinone/menaquinone biosynthesis C-methylase UbiE
MNKEKLKKIIKEENKTWSRIFSQELKNKNPELFSSFWWEEYYDEITKYMVKLLKTTKDPLILEAGAGSGKASLLLGKNLRRVLLDISVPALKYAQFLTKRYGCTNVETVEGNIFEMNFKNETFDLVWNIGVLEHYSEKEIINILKEMIRVTKKGGFITFGTPNKLSGPILKAKLLSYPLFKFIPGYRLSTEKFYSKKEIKYLVDKAFKETNKKYVEYEVNYFGNCLIMEFPKWVLKFFGKPLSKIFKRNKFLTMTTIKVGYC